MLGYEIMSKFGLVKSSKCQFNRWPLSLQLRNFFQKTFSSHTVAERTKLLQNKALPKF